MSLVKFISPLIELVPAASGSWQTIDVSSYVSASATGVMLFFYSVDYDGHCWGVRKKGSTDEHYWAANMGNSSYAYIGIDSDKKFEVKFQDKTYMHIYLIGYFREEAVFFTNAVEFSAASAYTWTDIDISSATGTDTAIAAFFEVDNGTPCNFRKNGSTSVSRSSNNTHDFGIAGLDGSEICETYISNVSQKLYLVGYLIKDVVMHTEKINRNPTADDAWHDLTALPSGSVGGIYQITTDIGYGGVRCNGDTGPIALPGVNKYAITKCDASGTVEGYRDNTNSPNILEIGYVPMVYVSPAVAPESSSAISGTLRASRKVMSAITSSSSMAATVKNFCKSVATLLSDSTIAASLTIEHALAIIKAVSDTIVTARLSQRLIGQVDAQSSVNALLARYLWITGSEITSESSIAATALRLHTIATSALSQSSVAADTVMRWGAKTVTAAVSWIRAWAHDGDDVMAPKYTFYYKR